MKEGGTKQVEAADSKLPILVVEDEEAIRRGVCDVLAYHGYAPVAAEDGDVGLATAREQRFALIVLDVMLPGRSGFEICRELRAGGDAVPVLMLTARGSEEDVLTGFRAGADDYVTKPFSVAELTARVQALLRRSGGLPAPAHETFVFGPWRIDPENLRAESEFESAGDGTCGAASSTPSPERIDLSAREVEILQLFVRERGRIVSRRMLLAEVWRTPHPDRIETRTVDMQIAKLRKKLDREGRPLLETVRGAGYRFEPEPGAGAS